MFRVIVALAMVVVMCACLRLAFWAAADGRYAEAALMFVCGCIEPTALSYLAWPSSEDWP